MRMTASNLQSKLSLKTIYAAAAAAAHPLWPSTDLLSKPFLRRVLELSRAPAQVLDSKRDP